LRVHIPPSTCSSDGSIFRQQTMTQLKTTNITAKLEKVYPKVGASDTRDLHVSA